jgi:hypothetical protein
MAQRDFLQEAIGSLQQERVAAPAAGQPQDQDLLQQALGELRPEGIQRAAVREEVPTPTQPWVERLLATQPLRSLVGTGQELAKFVTGIPRLAGIDIEAPEVVETGLGEKIGAGALEYLLGGTALKAAPAIQRGIQAARRLPAVGRAITAPITQRAAGMAALGALEQPEEPLKGAALGAVISPVAELGLMGAGKVAAPLLRPLATTKRFVQRGLKKVVPKELYPYIEGRINDIRSSLRGSSSEETSNRDVFNKVSRHYDELVGHPEDLYGNPITAETSEFILPEASFHGRYEDVRNMVPDLVVNKEPLAEEVSQQIGKLNTKLEQFKESPIFAKETAEIKNVVDSIGKARISNFEDLDNLKILINARLRDPSISIAEKSSLIPIKDSLREILPASMEGRPDVKNLWATIDRDYKEQTVPFKEVKKDIKSPFIKAYHGAGENVDNLVRDYIKPGKDDLLDNFLKIVPDAETRNIAAFDYLKQGGPNEVMTQYSKLSPYQRRNLFPEHYEELNELEKLHKRMPIAFKVPKEVETTRKTVGQFLPHLLLGAGGYAISPGLAALGVAPVVYRGALERLAKTETGRKLLMSELEKVGIPRSPLLKRMARGGILGAILPVEGER